MASPSPRFARALVAPLVVLALVGCGDDGDDEAADDPTTTTAEDASEPEGARGATGDETTTTESESEPASEPATEVDQEAVARAEAVNLVAGDLPAGWTSEPSSSDPEDDDTLNECLGFDFDEVTAGRAPSPDFALESDQGVQNAASLTAVVDDAEVASRVVEVVGTQAFGDCFTAAAAAEDAEVTADFTADPSFPAYGDGSSRLTGSIAAADGSFTYAVDIVAVATGDVVSLVIIGAAPPPAPTDLLPGLVGAVADRQATA